MTTEAKLVKLGVVTSWVICVNLLPSLALGVAGNYICTWVGVVPEGPGVSCVEGPCCAAECLWCHVNARAFGSGEVRW